MIKRSVALILLCLVLCTCVLAEEYEYDDLNRVTKVTYEDGSYVQYSYDKNGNITSTTVHDAKFISKLRLVLSQLDVESISDATDEETIFDAKQVEAIVDVVEVAYEAIDVIVECAVDIITK